VWRRIGRVGPQSGKSTDHTLRATRPPEGNFRRPSSFEAWPPPFLVLKSQDSSLNCRNCVKFLYFLAFNSCSACLDPSGSAQPPMSEFPPLIKPNQAQPPFFAGVDVGGTTIKLGVVDNQGNSLSRLSIPTQIQDGPEAGVRRIGEALRRAADVAALRWDDVAQVGLGSPGTMDLEKGLLLEPCNLPGWWNFPIR